MEEANAPDPTSPGGVYLKHDRRLVREVEGPRRIGKLRQLMSPRRDTQSKERPDVSTLSRVVERVVALERVEHASIAAIFPEPVPLKPFLPMAVRGPHAQVADEQSFAILQIKCLHKMLLRDGRKSRGIHSRQKVDLLSRPVPVHGDVWVPPAEGADQ